MIEIIVPEIASTSRLGHVDLQDTKVPKRPCSTDKQGFAIISCRMSEVVEGP